jgi:tetratricopeptide (TPR) repeat protein
MRLMSLSHSLLFAASVVLLPVAVNAEDAGKADPQAEFMKLLQSMAAMGEAASKQQGDGAHKAFTDFKKQVEAQADATNNVKRDQKTPETMEELFNPFLGQLTQLAGGSMNVLNEMAAAELKQQRAADSNAGTKELHGKAAVLGVTGKTDEALSVYQDILGKNPEDAAAFFGMAALFAEKGMKSESLASLGKAVAFDVKYRDVAQRDPAFSKLRDDERFKALVSK